MFVCVSTHDGKHNCFIDPDSRQGSLWDMLDTNLESYSYLSSKPPHLQGFSRILHSGKADYNCWIINFNSVGEIVLYLAGFCGFGGWSRCWLQLDLKQNYFRESWLKFIFFFSRKAILHIFSVYDNRNKFSWNTIRTLSFLHIVTVDKSPSHRFGVSRSKFLAFLGEGGGRGRGSLAKLFTLD